MLIPILVVLLYRWSISLYFAPSSIVPLQNKIMSSKKKWVKNMLPPTLMHYLFLVLLASLVDLLNPLANNIKK